MRTALAAASLIDGSASPPLRDAVVVIEDGIIVEVTTRDQWSRGADGSVALVDHGDATVMPGLIDNHVHLCLDASETTEECIAGLVERDDIQIAIVAAENARRCLSGGVTTVRDCGGRGNLVQRLRDLVDAGRMTGPRILACGAPITTTAGHANWMGTRADSTDEVLRTLREFVQNGADFIKVMATGGRMTAGSNMSRLQYPPETLARLAEDAHRLSRHVAAHVLGTEGIRAAVDAGIDTLEHCRWQLPDDSFDYDEETLQQMARQKTGVSLTMASNIRELLAAKRADPEHFCLGPIEAERFRTEADMVRRGLETFVTSDAGVTRCKFEEFHLSIACAVEFLGLTPLEAIEHATSRAARAVGLEGVTGRLSPGLAADLIVVDGDPAVDIDDLGHVRHVYRNGALAASGGAVATPGQEFQIMGGRS